MMQDAVGGIYTNQGMPYVLEICATCGREFKRYAGHIYKDVHQIGGKTVTKFYCRPSCWPAGGIINEGKYDDKKQKKQRHETYMRSKDKVKRQKEG